MTPLTSIQMIKTLIDIKKTLNATFNNNKFNYPSLFLLSSKDQICRNVYLHRLLKTMTFDDLELQEFNEGCHELLTDEYAEKAAGVITDWINARLDRATDFGNLKRIPYSN
jgi:alpha-beta hydrolase superfamily lysophospholipase